MQEAVMGPRIRKNGVKDERMRVQQVDLQLAAVLCLLTSQNARLHEKLAEAGRLSKLVLVTCAKVRHICETFVSCKMSKVSRSATVELQLAIFPTVKICLYGKMQKLAAFLSPGNIDPNFRNI